MKVLRVFPEATSYTPDDEMAFVGDPPFGLFRPKADEVHVSAVFSWQKREAYRLAEAWGCYYPCVKVGGPAFGTRAEGFTPGHYVKNGVTFTSRGCVWSCPWCLVPKTEGAFFELKDVAPGNIVQDNNILAASRGHWRKVCQMLRTQSAIQLSGGLDARLLKDWHIDDLRGLRIRELYFAYDNEERLSALKRVAEKCSPYWKRRQLRCYVLLGFDDDTIGAARRRLEQVWDLGFMPFAQLYQPLGVTTPAEYSDEWCWLQREWARPAIMFATHHPLPRARAASELAEAIA